MNALRRALADKIRSKRGASITFALLLFLVCAAVGGVVLAAGTASSGRVSELAEMDQRYYAVASAAELFHSALDGQNYTLELKKTATTTRNADDPTDPGTASAPVYRFRFYSGGTELCGSTEAANLLVSDFLSGAALDYVLGENRAGIENAYAMTAVPGAGLTDAGWKVTGKTLYVSDPTAADAGSGYRVRVTAVMDRDSGSIVFTFSNIPDNAGDPVFSLCFTLKCTCAADEKERERTARYTPVEAGVPTTVEKTTVVTTRTLVLRYDAQQIGRATA